MGFEGKSGLISADVRIDKETLKKAEAIKHFHQSVRQYSESDIVVEGDVAVLPVELAFDTHNLPIESPIPGVRFAWLSPNQDSEQRDPGLLLDCAIETGVMLATKMEETRLESPKAVLFIAPTKKSGDMAKTAGRIAATLTDGEVLPIEAGGGVINNQEPELDDLGRFFTEEQCSGLRVKELNVGEKTEPYFIRTRTGERAIVFRYRPVTGKDKFMFLTDKQYGRIFDFLEKGAVLIIVEDVITTGTTVGVAEDLLHVGGIGNWLNLIAVAREGDDFRGLMDCAIQLPKL